MDPDHPFGPNVKINNTFFRKFQCAFQNTANYDTYGTALKEMSAIRIRIGIKMESRIRMQIGIKNDADPKLTTQFFGKYGGRLATKIWELYLVAMELMMD